MHAYLAVAYTHVLNMHNYDYIYSIMEVDIIFQELTEGEKDLFFICFNCTFLEPTCYTNIAKPETLHSPLNSDILKRVPSSHQTALILGPAVLDVAGTDAYSNNIGEPASKDLTVRDLLKLHALIKTGLQVQPLLAHAVLRQKDEIEHQGRNLDQKPSSRAPSPTKVNEKDFPNTSIHKYMYNDVPASIYNYYQFEFLLFSSSVHLCIILVHTILSPPVSPRLERKTRKQQRAGLRIHLRDGNSIL